MIRHAADEPNVIGRAQLFAAIFVCAALNGLYVQIAGSIASEGWQRALLTLFSVSAIIWIALFAIIQLSGDGRAEPLRRHDSWILACGIVACFLPTGWEPRLYLLVASIYLWRTSPPGSAAHRVAVIAASLSAPLIWGRLAVHFLAPELLAMDAALVGALSGHEVYGNTVAFAPSALASAGKRMVILPACSSFTNLSLSAVMLAVISQVMNFDVRWKLLLVALAMAAAAILVNVVRLTAIAQFPEHFDYLHHGGGAVLFGYAALVAMGVVAFAAVRSPWVARHA